jgi:hypothetical protein
MTAYTWNVVQTNYNTSDKFITTVHYTVNAVDGDYTASTYGTVGYTQGEGNIVAFDNLTPEIVIGWVKESLGQSTVEEALAAQITAQKNPVQLSGLPW